MVDEVHLVPECRSISMRLCYSVSDCFGPQFGLARVVSVLRLVAGVIVGDG